MMQRIAMPILFRLLSLALLLITLVPARAQQAAPEARTIAAAEQASEPAAAAIAFGAAGPVRAADLSAELEQARARSLEAISLAQQGDATGADAVMAAAAATAPEDPQVLGRSAVVDLYLGRPRDALSKLDRLPMVAAADLAGWHLNRSLALRALGRYEESQREYLAFRDAVATPARPARPAANPVDPSGSTSQAPDVPSAAPRRDQ